MHNTIEIEYNSTYFFCNMIKNILNDTFSYARKLDGFWGNGSHQYYIKNFPEVSIFHQFISFVIDVYLAEEVQEFDVDKQLKLFERLGDYDDSVARDYKKTSIEFRLLEYGLKHQSFDEWLKEKGTEFTHLNDEDITDYYASLYEVGVVWDLIENITDEVFFLLFTNRKLMMELNKIFADFITEMKVDEIYDRGIKMLFEKDGMLKRKTPPVWAKNAVFFRDRGHCTICNKDLTRLLSLQNDSNYDHIVPLALGGLNDVTNLQLLCKECNDEKGHNKIVTTNRYEKWY